MVGSSLRNAVQRRNHKERSQPVGRSRLGFLEKHKDYVVRAKDHHEKRDKLKRLSEKAAMRNKDEFYFGMIKSKTKNGVHIHERGTEVLGNDVVALLKTQDVGYVRAQLQAERKRVQALKMRIAPSIPNLRLEWLDEKPNRRDTLQKVGLITTASSSKLGKANATIGSQGKKTVWLDDADAIRAYSSRSLADVTSAATSLLEETNWLDELSDGSMSDGDDEETGLAPTEQELANDKAARQSQDRRQGEKHLGHLVSELSSRLDRLEKLQLAAEKLNLVRALMTNKGGRSTRVQSSKKIALTDAVMTGKMTKNGLAMPGVEDEDVGSTDDHSRTQRKLYRFSNERKR